MRRDQAALARLYDLTVDRVFAVAVRVLGDGHDAEEVVCDVFQQVWNRAHQYTVERGGVRRWIVVIAYTRALDLRRRLAERRREQPLHPDDGESAYGQMPDDPSQADLLDAIRAGSAIHGALAALPALQRELIGLSFLRGFSHQEIAQRHGLPLGTVKSHIRRGLLQLRTVLQERGFEP